MRINDTALGSLLEQAPPSAKQAESKVATVHPSGRIRRCGREVARHNELKTMRAVAQFGHLRVSDIARAVWSHCRYGEQVARRTVRRLIAQGLLVERRNPLGSKSLCISRVGATWLESRGIEAKHTLDLSSVSGPTFFHRTLATNYLVTRQTAGYQVAGEYLLLRKKLPFSIDKIALVLHKQPDGLVWQRRGDGGAMQVEFVEQEAAVKVRSEIEKCLRTVSLVGTVLPGDGNYVLAGLVFVFDRSLNHARKILLAANALWSERTPIERAALEQRVKLVAVEIREPLVWVSSSVTTLHEFRQRGRG